MKKRKYNVKPREVVAYICVVCRIEKTILKCDFEKRSRENFGRKPDTCSVGCANEKRRRVGAIKRGEALSETVAS